MKNVKISALTISILLFALGLLTGVANASFIMTLTDDGTNLIMRATGTYDLSGAEVSTRTEPDYQSAFATPFDNGGTYGWGVGTDVLSYKVDFVGSFTDTIGGAFIPLPTSVNTTTPFYFQTMTFDGEVIRFAQGTSNTGTVNETAIWENTTLADFGMVPGETINVSWTGDSATIQTIAIPEPSTVLLVGFGGLGAWLLRRNKNIDKK